MDACVLERVCTSTKLVNIFFTKKIEDWDDISGGFFPHWVSTWKDPGVYVCFLCVLIYSVLIASVYCLVNTSHSDLSSTNNEVHVLNVYDLYVGFIHYSCGHTLFGFCKITYTTWKGKLLLWKFKYWFTPPSLVFFPTIGIR